MTHAGNVMAASKLQNFNISTPFAILGFVVIPASITSCTRALLQW